MTCYGGVRRDGVGYMAVCLVEQDDGARTTYTRSGFPTREEAREAIRTVMKDLRDSCPGMPMNLVELEQPPEYIH